jgi:hypothetical protein
MLAETTTGIVAGGGQLSSTAVVGAFAQYTDGSGKFVDATWDTSDPKVIVVNDSQLRAIGRGRATLTARAEGKTATETFTVEPTMAGSWAGTVVIDECSAGSGSMGELICANATGHHGIFPVGAAVPVAFQITKNGTDLTATATSGALGGALTGTDRGQNYLTLKGDLVSGPTTATIMYWDSRVKIDVMDGFVAFEVHIAGVPSFANVTGHFDQVTRR